MSDDNHEMHDLKITEHLTLIAQEFNEAYEAVAEAKAVIRQQAHQGSDAVLLMAVVERIEWQLDRVEMAKTMLHGDILEQNTIIEELQRQREETIKLIRRMLGRK